MPRSDDSTCFHQCITLFSLLNTTFQFKERFDSLVLQRNFTQLCKKHAIVQEESGYPRNGTPMAVSISVLVHLVRKHTIQFIARLNLILGVSYDAIWQG